MTINIFLPMRNKFVYSYSIKIHATGFDKFLGKHFLLPAHCGSIFRLLIIVEAFSLQKVVEMLEQVVIGWREVRWIWRMRQNFVAQVVQLWKRWLCDMWLGMVVEKKWALSIDQCRLQELQSSVHPIDLLRILLRCNGFTRIQNAVVGQTPPNGGHDPSLVQVCLWEVLCCFFLV